MAAEITLLEDFDEDRSAPLNVGDGFLTPNFVYILLIVLHGTSFINTIKYMEISFEVSAQHLQIT